MAFIVKFSRLQEKKKKIQHVNASKVCGFFSVFSCLGNRKWGRLTVKEEEEAEEEKEKEEEEEDGTETDEAANDDRKKNQRGRRGK